MLKNHTRDFIIQERVLWCGNWWRQSWGLLLRGPQAAVFAFTKPRRLRLHTWGMRYPLDILVLDKNKRVKSITREIPPFSSHKPARSGHYLVEVPSGNLQDTAVGDFLSFP